MLKKALGRLTIKLEVELCSLIFTFKTDKIKGNYQHILNLSKLRSELQLHGPVASQESLALVAHLLSQELLDCLVLEHKKEKLYFKEVKGFASEGLALILDLVQIDKDQSFFISLEKH